MTFDNWVKNVKSTKGVDTDGYYSLQCMDLYNDYCHRVLEVNGKTGCASAKLIISKDKTIKKYTKQIKNTPSFVPQKGDIAVWTGGTYGHVAICYGEGDTSKFKTIDQNWQPLKLTDVWHNYTYLAPLYFLRPINQENINPKPKYKFKVGKNYTLQSNLKVRTGAGIDKAWKLTKDLTKDGQKHALDQKYATLKKGTVVTVQECKTLGNDEWIKIPSGWIAGYYDKEYLIK